jgi:hypothetical protein
VKIRNALLASAVAIGAVAPVAAVVVEAQPAAAAGCYAGRIFSDYKSIYGGYSVGFTDFYSGSSCYFNTYSTTCAPTAGRPYARVTDYTCYR